GRRLVRLRRQRRFSDLRQIGLGRKRIGLRLSAGVDGAALKLFVDASDQLRVLRRNRFGVCRGCFFLGLFGWGRRRGRERVDLVDHAAQEAFFVSGIFRDDLGLRYARHVFGGFGVFLFDGRGRGGSLILLQQRVERVLFFLRQLRQLRARALGKRVVRIVLRQRLEGERGLDVVFLESIRLAEVEERLGRDRRRAIAPDDSFETVAGGGVLLLAHVIGGDVVLVLREIIEALGELLLRLRRILGFRIVVHHALEEALRDLGIFLVAVGRRELVEVRHAGEVERVRNILVVRVHRLELFQRLDRLGVLLVEVIRFTEL